MLQYSEPYPGVPRLLNLADILQLIINGLEQRPLAQQHFIPESHQGIFHIIDMAWVTQNANSSPASFTVKWSNEGSI